MVLAPGTRLHAYEITGPVGAGGMGEVYRAHDPRLGRDVAVKVLPASVSADPAALARFEREARAIGSLNHPNIVNVFDTGSESGVSYVVMELLEGETLRARLQGNTAVAAATGKTPRPSSGAAPQGGLPRKKALEIAHQIAVGLAAAHARGIVHRDLKPENVFLTSDGRVKILDFGLARAVPDAVQQLSDAQTQVSPNVAADSVPGLVLGTVGYMAPEQVRGQVVDHRADIFAFGAVLYEMLTGQRAFDGDSPIETMSAILKADPLEQPAAVAIAGPLEPLLRHCLEKQPDERFQSARDLAFQLHAIASGTLSTTIAERAMAQPARSPRWTLAATIAIVALLAGAGLGYWLSARSGQTETIALAMPMPAGVRMHPGVSPSRAGGIAVSPDGRHVAFVGATTSTASQIYVRSLDAAAARPVPGTEMALYPSWSPDGRRIAFWQNGQFKHIAVEGGTPQIVTAARQPRSAAAWGRDDTLLLHTDYRAALMGVAVSGGTPTQAITDPGPNLSWFSPVWLPDGKRFLAVRFAYDDEVVEGAGIYLAGPGAAAPQLLVAGRISEVALGEHELFYRRGSQLVSQPFDPRAAKLSGEATVLSDHVSNIAAGGSTLAYYDPPTGLSAGHRITLFSRAGAVLSHLGEAGTFRDPTLSRDGRFLALARADENGLFSIWKYDVARNIDTRISGASMVAPVWTPDGQTILGGNDDALLRFDANGGGRQVVRPIGNGRYTLTMDAAPETKDALAALITTSGAQVALVALDGKSDPRPVGDPQPAGPMSGAIAPDGRWVALTGVQGSVSRLFVQPLDRAGPRVPVTGVEARWPRWRRDGRELYYIAGVRGTDVDVMAVPVTWTASGPDFGTPQKLFTIKRPVLANRVYDVTADGQTFVALSAEDLPPSPISVRLRR